MSELLLLGASGMLGRSVSSVARDRGVSFIRVVRRASCNEDVVLDLGEAREVARLIAERRPRTVINCAGVVPQVVAPASVVIALNAVLPNAVAEALDRHGGRLVQVSTDCVFSGRRGSYTERDSPDPLDLYGYTKALGEIERPPHLTVRTSFVGLDPGQPRGLLSWLAAQAGVVPGFRNARWSGLAADALAAVLLDLANERSISGLLHVHGEPIDKCSLLKLMASVFDLPVEVAPVPEPWVDRTLGSVRSLNLSIPPLQVQLESLRERALREGWPVRT